MSAKKILFVCLGNICRSPAAETVFIKKLKDLQRFEEFEVESRGTGDWHVGESPDPRMQKELTSRGYTDFSTAQQINLKDLEHYDLILVMDDSNYKNVTKLTANPQLISKIKKLSDYHPSADVNHVPDPYFGGASGFTEVVDMLETSLDQLLKEI